MVIKSEESQIYVKRNQLNIAGIGLPGSGKGTQGMHLKSKYGLHSISTGELLRSHIEQGTEIGKLAKHIVEVEGKLVPDELIVKIYSEELLKPNFRYGHFGDGTGRRLNQYLSYEKMLGEDFYDGAIYFNLHPDVVRERLLGRLCCNECGAPYNIKEHGVRVGDKCRVIGCGGTLQPRSDDKLERIENRISEFEKNSPEYLEHLRRKGILWEVDSTMKPAQISHIINGFVDNAIAKKLNTPILGPKHFHITDLSKLGEKTDE